MKFLWGYLVLLVCFFSPPGFANSGAVDVWSKQNHHVQLLEDNVAALEARLQLIEQAEEFIVIETFIYGLDLSGEWIAQTLVNKKKQNPNVRIRILIDSVPALKTLDAFHDREFKKSGIEFRLFNQAASLEFFEMNFRNHRKLFASEKEAIVGGRNVADDYFMLATDSNFLDRDIRIIGPVQHEMLETFEMFWTSKHSSHVKEISFPNMNDYRHEDRKRSHEYAIPDKWDSSNDVYDYEKAVQDWSTRTLRAQRFCNSDYASSEGLESLQRMRIAGQRAFNRQPIFEIRDIRFVSDGPQGARKKETMTGPILLDRIRHTQKSLVIENGYIIPDNESWSIYESLMTSGKEISILSNSRKASGRENIVNSLTISHAKKFAYLGGRVFLYAGTMLPGEENPEPQRIQNSHFATHAKSFVIDSQSCMVGTANFDPRSLRGMNAELAVLIDDLSFCQHLESMILVRAQNADLMKSDGKMPSGVETNKIETLQQRLIILLLPVIRIFERLF